MLSHNLGDKFLLEKSGNQEKYLSPYLLDTWLDQLPEGTPVTVVIEACYSGNFISSNGTPTALAGENRTIIVSARGDRQSKIARSSSFSRTFFSLIESNETISNAFEQAAQKMERMVYHRGQSPQIESSGDGNPNQRDDYLTLEDSYLPANIISLAAPPNITTITQPTELEKGMLLKAPVCDNPTCEEKIKEETGADIRVIPDGCEDSGSKCIYCDGQSKIRPFFARGY